MNSEMNRRLNAFERGDQFLEDHPVTPANARLTALKVLLQAVIVEMKDHRDDQDQGGGKSSDGTDDRILVDERTRRLMRKIAKIAKALDPIQFPGVRNTLRVPYGASYAALQARAETFLATIGPIKAEFVSRGLPADFDEELQGLIAEFATASGRQSSGRAQQVGGTAGLDPASRRGLGYVRELDSILFSVYENNPALYAAWKSASRVYRAPLRAPEDSGVAPDAGVPSDSAAPTV